MDSLKLDFDFEIETNVKLISLDIIVPLGLLVNELVSNSMKYAFENTNKGSLKIKMEFLNDLYLFSYF